MIYCMCIKKYKNKHGQVTGYRLMDTDGKEMNVDPIELKSVIKQGKLEVLNLLLTSDNRLLDRDAKKRYEEVKGEKLKNHGDKDVKSPSQSPSHSPSHSPSQSPGEGNKIGVLEVTILGGKLMVKVNNSLDDPKKIFMMQQSSSTNTVIANKVYNIDNLIINDDGELNNILNIDLAMSKVNNVRVETLVAKVNIKNAIIDNIVEVYNQDSPYDKEHKCAVWSSYISIASVRLKLISCKINSADIKNIMSFDGCIVNYVTSHTYPFRVNALMNVDKPEVPSSYSYYSYEDFELAVKKAVRRELGIHSNLGTSLIMNCYAKKFSGTDAIIVNLRLDTVDDTEIDDNIYNLTFTQDSVNSCTVRYNSSVYKQYYSGLIATLNNLAGMGMIPDSKTIVEDLLKYETSRSLNCRKLGRLVLDNYDKSIDTRRIRSINASNAIGNLRYLRYWNQELVNRARLASKAGLELRVILQNSDDIELPGIRSIDHNSAIKKSFDDSDDTKVFIKINKNISNPSVLRYLMYLLPKDKFGIITSYGLDVYEYFNNRGYEVRVLNEDDIPDKMKIISKREKIIGQSGISKIEEYIRSIPREIDLVADHDIPKKCDIALPDIVKKAYGIDDRVGQDGKIDAITAQILRLLEHFESTTLPFMNKSIDLLSNNSNIKIYKELVVNRSNIRVFDTYIIEDDNDQMDHYLIALNGNNLINCVYVGDFEFNISCFTDRGMISDGRICSDYRIWDYSGAFKYLSYFDTIDIKSGLLVQKRSTSNDWKDINHVLRKIKEILRYCPILTDKNTGESLGVCEDNFMHSICTGVNKAKYILTDRSIIYRDIDKISAISLEVDTKVIDLSDRFKSSILVRYFNRSDTKNTESNLIKPAKVSALWQIATAFPDEIDIDSYGMLDSGLIDSIIGLSIFKEIDEDDYEKFVSKKIHRSYEYDLDNGGYIRDSAIGNTSRQQLLKESWSYVNRVLEVNDGVMSYYYTYINYNSIANILGVINDINGYDVDYTFFDDLKFEYNWLTVNCAVAYRLALVCNSTYGKIAVSIYIDRRTGYTYLVAERSRRKPSKTNKDRVQVYCLARLESFASAMDIVNIIRLQLTKSVRSNCELLDSIIDLDIDLADELPKLNIHKNEKQISVYTSTFSKEYIRTMISKIGYLPEVGEYELEDVSIDSGYPEEIDYPEHLNLYYGLKDDGVDPDLDSDRYYVRPIHLGLLKREYITPCRTRNPIINGYDVVEELHDLKRNYDRLLINKYDYINLDVYDDYIAAENGDNKIKDNLYQTFSTRKLHMLYEYYHPSYDYYIVLNEDDRIIGLNDEPLYNIVHRILGRITNPRYYKDIGDMQFSSIIKPNISEWLGDNK